MASAAEYVDQIYVYQGGYYFTLDGSTAYRDDPVIVTDTPPIDTSRSGAPRLQTRAGDESARERLDLLIAENPEARFMLSQGMRIVFSMEAGMQLEYGDGAYRFVKYEFGDGPAKGIRTAGGIAVGDINTIYVTESLNNRIIQSPDPNPTDYNNYQEFAAAQDAHKQSRRNAFNRVFREEVTHRIDNYIGQAIGMEEDADYYSHRFVDDSVTDPLLESSDVTMLAERMSAFGDGRVEQMLSDMGFPFDAYIDGSVMRYLEDEMRQILTLENGYENLQGENREKYDVYFDTEVMTKFHVFRSQLEDWYAQSNGTAPDPYSLDPNGEVMQLLAAMAPNLTRAYLEGWLPAANIVTNIEDASLRTALLRAYADKDDEASGYITASELRSLRSLELPEGVSLDTLLDSDPNNDAITVGGQSLPVTLAPNARNIM